MPRNGRMQLFYSPSSPYVRKVLVIAHEVGLSGQIELIASEAHPLHPDPRIKPWNPTGKIPTLVTNEDEALFDSRVIAEYLDMLHDGPKLYPFDSSRWRILTMQSLAHEIMDAAITVRTERTVRPETYKWDVWHESHFDKIHRCLELFERQVEDWKTKLNGGLIAMGCALGYLDFRFEELQWRVTNPKAAKWFLEFSARPSMLDTRPDR